MSFHNPDVPWWRLERALSGKSGPAEAEDEENGPAAEPEGKGGHEAEPEGKGRRRALWALPAQQVVDPLIVDGDGGDSPAWSRKREPYRPAPGLVRAEGTVDYAELHCHTNFSFLDGASHPEELAEEAARLGLTGLAVTDHDGFYGVVRFSQAARELSLPTIFGAELSLGLTRPQNGEADPEGTHLPALAHGHEGYARLARVISEAQLRGGEKGRPDYGDLERVAETLRDHVLVLTGCRKGTVPSALATGGMERAAYELDRLVALFGAPNVAVELTDHGDPIDGDRNDALFELARSRRLEVVATNNVHYATPSRRRLATALAAVRARRSLDEMDGWLPAAGTAHLRSGAEMARRFAGYPGAVENAAVYGGDLAFDLDLVAPRLPDYPVGDGHTEMSWLRKLTMEGAAQRYGPPAANPKAYQQIEYELRMIEELGFPGYFLVVYDIVRFCRENRIYCQGRGSAANSAVCYALWITNVDAVKYNLLFERFLAPERDGPPDIDVDIESDRREEVIQHVYEKYGREHTAQVANVISYRPRSAVRDMARAFGFSPGQQDAWSKQIDRWGDVAATDTDMPETVRDFANEVQTFPRHLGIHSGGMVICDRPIIEVCPVEWGRMPGRTVLQWDKDDCAAVDLVKFDLLGLGMLSALHYAYDMIEDELDIGTMPLDDPEVYEMLCRADSVGVFQVESRAQMATLPRLKPREFYDLVIEVALIRPGPIQGGSVHPYIRRKNGLEAPRVPHPLMENALAKTLGVPLFQEQLMQLAIDVAGFDPSEADQLRRAMGSKRSVEKMERIKKRLYDGMAANEITGQLADDLFVKLSAFASYGFPESHAMSFAYLVYASAWLKRYHPAAFCAALLNAQPMGFYSPQTLVDDARRHGVEVRRPDINRSDATATLETTPESRWRSAAGEPPHAWGIGGPAVRQGLSSIRTIGADLAERIEQERRTHGPYRSMTDLARRTGCSTAHLEALATADAFAGFGLSRREALWAAGAASQDKPDRLPGTVTGTEAPVLPGMSDVDILVADVWATGLSPETHPARFLREELDRAGALPIERLAAVEAGTRIRVGGIVTHRQRPATAGGVTFVNLEDETGMLNVTCSPGLWQRYRKVARMSSALLVRGRLEKAEGVLNLVADRLDAISPPVTPASRDFR
ncbi:error-prone DNA polymerase [Actinoplanes campanulatus]|uniref:Error-prone DNA polymerase n=1 Tax=Actinoplanes campanulatus TaxID=113559 RepID=A0A7W5ACM9_9ACTN|nr:error-prone DNA polymerase [Actinoplanes campanulatus]MBB3093529.1 error-prone DNA polymerase [Actinoplanes campanulatus]GGN03973.1 error-prone DNA polymerase [Actinoplanes campanulatus]GID35398.1 error-prone DNA polymerase [Actinoplanes campanulatus]